MDYEYKEAAKELFERIWEKNIKAPPHNSDDVDATSDFPVNTTAVPAVDTN